MAQDELLRAILVALGNHPATSVDLPAAAHGGANTPSNRPLKILLAEDQPVNQRLAVGMLSKRGHSVVVVGNGREALNALAHDTFDLVLMDLQMPEMDGFEATATIRRQEANTSNHLPVVALTAHAMKGDCEQCLNAGFDAYLAKPFTSKALYDVVENIPLGSNHAVPAAVASAAALQATQDASPPSRSVAQSWDHAAALKRVDGDESFLRELAQLFTSECSVLLHDVESAIQSGLATAVSKAAHALKGNVAVLCANPTFDQALRMETNAKNQQLSGADDDLLKLQARLEELRSNLAAYLADSTSPPLSNAAGVLASDSP